MSTLPDNLPAILFHILTICVQPPQKHRILLIFPTIQQPEIPRNVGNPACNSGFAEFLHRRKCHCEWTFERKHARSGPNHVYVHNSIPKLGIATKNPRL